MSPTSLLFSLNGTSEVVVIFFYPFSMFIIGNIRIEFEEFEHLSEGSLTVEPSLRVLIGSLRGGCYIHSEYRILMMEILT